MGYFLKYRTTKQKLVIYIGDMWQVMIIYNPWSSTSCTLPFWQTVYKFYGKYEVDWDKTNEYFQTFKRVTKEVDLKKYKS